MRQVKCPECGAIAQMAMNTRYCAKCGWNREGAIRRLKRFLWLLPVLIATFDCVGIFGAGFAKHDWPSAILIALLPTLLLGFVYAGVKQGLTKLRAPATESSANASSVASDAAAQSAVAAEKSEQYDFLISLPPPRPVQLGRRGKRLLTLLLAFAVGMEAFLLWSFYGAWQRSATVPNSRGLEILLICFMALVAALPFFVRRGILRDKALMESGVLAIGRITTQKNVKNASLITFEFRDESGRTLTGSGNDLSRSYYPEINVPVFYDAENPKRNLATCASFFEIAAPGG